MPETDVAIVGAGAGGLAAAWRLTSRGVRVTVLEAGRSYRPSQDYPQSGRDFEWRSFPYSDRLGSPGAPQHTFGETQPIDAELRGYRSSSPGRGVTTTASRRYIGYAHVRGVGGSTLHFQGEAHRFHPDSLRMRSRFGVGADWPLAWEDLEEYYDLAESRIGVAAPAFNPQRPRKRAPRLPHHPLSYASQRLAPAFAAVGLRLIPNALAVLSRPFRGRRPCNYCNSCTAGCPLGDKGSADVTFLPPALATGQLDLRPEVEVIELETDANGLASGVVYSDRSGERRRLRARYILLAAGAIESPRLLLSSRPPHFLDGLANGSGQVGRNLTETLYFLSTAIHPERLDSFRGLPIDGSAWELAVPCRSRSYAGGFRLMTAHGAAGLRGPLGYAALGADIGVERQRRVASIFGRGVAVGAVGEWLPNERTRVELDPESVDGHGLPVAKITSWLGDNERAMIESMASTVRRILAAAGAEIVAERSALDTFHATYVLGTCRMGESASESVADGDGFSHEVPNLGFADGSLLPSSGAGDSPFLTITALALRTADRLIERSRGRRPLSVSPSSG